MFPQFRVVHGDPYHSDHRSVIVHLEEEDRFRGGRRMDLLGLRLGVLRRRVVMRWWGRLGRTVGGGALGVSAALKSVAYNLQAWDEDVVGDLPKRIRE
jgi:hypothetical protein